jgi:hypothetical protein
MTHHIGLGAIATPDTFTRIVAQLDASHATYTLHEHAPSVTIQDADANLWFPVERLVKTIAFRVKAGGGRIAHWRLRRRSWCGSHRRQSRVWQKISRRVR